jgi:hypothetical protein
MTGASLGWNESSTGTVDVKAARKRMRSMLTTWLSSSVVSITSDFGRGVIVDPAAAHFLTELLNRGFFVIDGKNDVLEGLRKVSSMLGLKRIRIHERNQNLIAELRNYSWDDKRVKLGFEEPLKDHDHAPDALRYYVHTRISNWRIAV